MKYLAPYIFIVLLFGLAGCYSDSEFASAPGDDTGVGGSYARFLALNNFLYVVDDSSIKTFSLTNPSEPEQVDQKEIGERIESIFQFAGNLFIGSGAGLFIYNIGADGIPTQLSATSYFESFRFFACDPVVANSTYAYVTLNSKERIENPCADATVIDINMLKIYNVEDLTAPRLLAEYDMHAPKGVGLDGNILFLCDDDQGLKVFDVADPFDIKLLFHFDDFNAFDVIPLDGLLLVVGPDNVYQFDYSDIEDVKLIAQIPIEA